MTPVWRSATKYIVAIGLVGFGLWIVYLSRPVIPLLIFAGLLALLVSPIKRFLQTSLRMPLWLAITITYLLLLVVLAVLPWLILTSLSQTVSAFDASPGRSRLTVWRASHSACAQLPCRFRG